MKTTMTSLNYIIHYLESTTLLQKLLQKLEIVFSTYLYLFLFFFVKNLFFFSFRPFLFDFLLFVFC